MTEAEIEGVLQEYLSKPFRTCYFGSREGNITDTLGLSRYYNKEKNEPTRWIEFENGEYAEHTDYSDRGTYIVYEWYRLSDKWFVVVEPGDAASAYSDIWHWK